MPYHTFTTARTTEPDMTTLLAQLRALDPTAGMQRVPGTPTAVVKKSTPWLPAHIAAAQTVIDTCPASTPQLTAQAAIDAWPIELKAALVLIMEQFNALRLLVSLPPFTTQQFMDAIKAKAASWTG